MKSFVGLGLSQVSTAYSDAPVPPPSSIKPSDHLRLG